MNFTVATPVFNGMPWLRLCVASVRDQISDEKAEIGDLKAATGDLKAVQQPQVSPPLRVEHIIQDAGSPGIEDFAREAGAEFCRDGKLVFRFSAAQDFSPFGYHLTLHSESDGGMYDAVNRAWLRATGDIISYLNADEQYLPGTLDRVGRFFLENPQVELLFGDALLLNPAGLPVSYRRVVRPSQAHTRAVHLGTLSCAMFFRRSLLEKGFFFDPQWKAIGDAEWVWRVLGSGAKAGILNKPLSAFTLTGSNLGATPASLREAADWRRSGPSSERLASPLLRASHWMKKAIAGAYFPQAVTSAVFTVTSPAKRFPIQNPALGSQWPK